MLRVIPRSGSAIQQRDILDTLYHVLCPAWLGCLVIGKAQTNTFSKTNSRIRKPSQFKPIRNEGLSLSFLPHDLILKGSVSLRPRDFLHLSALITHPYRINSDTNATTPIFASSFHIYT